MHDRLRRVDLNLLLVFDALYRHKSVVGAANELAMSPSAVSHALARLRTSLSDELFVRYGSAMQPTARAEQMATTVVRTLSELDWCLESARPFHPATSKQTFVFAATDFTAFAVLPALIGRLESVAPHLRFRMVYSTHSDSLEELQAGRIHFALGLRNGPATTPPEGVEIMFGPEDEYVVATRHDHPVIRDSLSLEQYLQARHVVVVPWFDTGSIISATLERLGLKRDVAIQLPSLLAAPFIVAKSNYLITLPRRVAEQFCGAAPLAIHPAPFQIPRYTLEVYFHHRHAGIPGHAWLQQQISTAFAAVWL
ncbi:LysR family transcriptional regulator [Ralstonia chuxiongensis]|uniref:LysR family transcriptional regulator n=1 Tax=Ralstonia chuxiongensis TaxID=2957504 RepID=A0AA41X0J4_9RALS|nr:LysR family transcriptional regulator [Ralstonia chuxiongensis]MCP1175857.1 LysR family transcriptional regulator [Ralstonia chuxiongensis]